MKRSSRHSKERKLIPWFLSLLFCMLNRSSLFVCGMCFTVAIILLTTDRDVGSFVVLVFISLLSNLIISFYILIRELLYKLIHCLGYRAQPDLKVLRMRRGFDIHFPVFEKYGQDYKLLYKKRSEASNRVFAYMFRVLLWTHSYCDWLRLYTQENSGVLKIDIYRLC